MSRELFNSNQTYLIVCLVLSLLHCSIVVADQDQDNESKEVVVKLIRPDWWEAPQYRNPFPDIKDEFKDYDEPKYGQDGINPDPRYEEDRIDGNDNWPDGFDQGSQQPSSVLVWTDTDPPCVEIYNNEELSMRLENKHIKENVKEIALCIEFATSETYDYFDDCVYESKGTFEVEFTPANIDNPNELDTDNSVTYKFREKGKTYLNLEELGDFQEYYISYIWKEQPQWEKITIRLRDAVESYFVVIKKFDIRTICREPIPGDKDFSGKHYARGSSKYICSYDPDNKTLSPLNGRINSLHYNDSNSPYPIDANDVLLGANVSITGLKLERIEPDSVWLTGGVLVISNDLGIQFQTSLPHVCTDDKNKESTGFDLYAELFDICFDPNTPSPWLQEYIERYRYTQARPVLLMRTTEDGFEEAIREGLPFLTDVEFTIGLSFPRTYSIPGSDIVATASSANNQTNGPDKTIDGSGLDGNAHSTNSGDMWLSDIENWAWIQYEFDRVYKLHEATIWNYNSLDEQMRSLGAKDITIEVSIDPNEWLYFKDTVISPAIGTEDYNTPTVIDLEGEVARYVKLWFWTNHGGILPEYGLSETQFTYQQTRATSPYPADGQILEWSSEEPEVELSWIPGIDVSSHMFYIGNDPNNLEYIGEFDDNVIDINISEPGQYYWKVNEVNEFDPVVWEGKIWSIFLNEDDNDKFIIDDFEDYNDFEGHEIWRKWLDGIGYDDIEGNGTGAKIGHWEPPFMENEIVHSGRQSMPFYYDNTGDAADVNYSEVQFEFEPQRDWTTGDSNNLSFWIFGDSNNTQDDMYVKILDSFGGQGIIEPYNQVDLQLPQWQQLTFGLDEFKGQGIDLSRVQWLVIGVGNPKQSQPRGAGKVLVDDVAIEPSHVDEDN